MENKSHALIAGLFTIILGLALALTALWLNRDRAVRIPYELVTTSSIAGLTPQAAVRYRGLEVGRVEHIGFDPKVPGQILVRIGVEKSTPVTRSAFATLGYQGVTGLAYIQLDDDGESTELLASAPGAFARLPLKPGLLDVLTTRGQDILIQVEEVAQRLSTLLEPENQKLLAETLVSLNEAAREVGKLGTRIEPTLAQLPALVSQAQATLAQLPALASQAQATLALLPALTSQAQVTLSNLDAAAQEFGKLGARLEPTLARMPALADEARETLSALGVASTDFAKLTARLQAPGGTLERATASLDQIAASSAAITLDTLPRINRFVDTATISARRLNRVIEQIGDRPQSLLFGEAAIVPGPGEPGHIPVAASR